MRDEKLMRIHDYLNKHTWEYYIDGIDLAKRCTVCDKRELLDVYGPKVIYNTNEKRFIKSNGSDTFSE
jgi:hypothetical protein